MIEVLDITDSFYYRQVLAYHLYCILLDKNGEVNCSVVILLLNEVVFSQGMLDCVKVWNKKLSRLEKRIVKNLE